MLWCNTIACILAYYIFVACMSCLQYGLRLFMTCCNFGLIYVAGAYQRYATTQQRKQQSDVLTSLVYASVWYLACSHECFANKLCSLQPCLNYASSTSVFFRQLMSGQSDYLHGLSVVVSVAVLAEISLRSPRKIIIFTIKKMLTGSKYPKNNKFNFEKNFTGRGSTASSGRHSNDFSCPFLCTCVGSKFGWEPIHSFVIACNRQSIRTNGVSPPSVLSCQ